MGQEEEPGREEVVEDRHDEMAEVGTLAYEAEVGVGDLEGDEDVSVHLGEEEDVGVRLGEEEDVGVHLDEDEEAHLEVEGHSHSSSISYVEASNVCGVYGDGDGEDHSLAYDVVEVEDTDNEEDRSLMGVEVEVLGSVYSRSVTDDCTLKDHWKGFHHRDCMTFLRCR